eukprot:m.94008 g.94008  ORF g.94008 m.94008 type:complete len:120 (-) comp13014_c0_seq1:614-973(-)
MAKSKRKDAKLYPLRAFGAEDEDTIYTAEQFLPLPVKVPTRSILLAIFLLLGGTVLLLFGCLAFLGHIGSHDEKENKWLSMIIVGSIMTLPGGYHTYLAFQAWREVPGYSFADIPSFDD